MTLKRVTCHHGARGESMCGTTARPQTTTNYHNMHFYVPETRGYRMAASFDLYLQHCMLPDFTPKKHVTKVDKEIIELIQKLEPQTKKALIKKLAQSLHVLAD